MVLESLKTYSQNMYMHVYLCTEATKWSRVPVHVSTWLLSEKCWPCFSMWTFRDRVSVLVTVTLAYNSVVSRRGRLCAGGGSLSNSHSNGGACRTGLPELATTMFPHDCVAVTQQGGRQHVALACPVVAGRHVTIRSLRHDRPQCMMGSMKPKQSHFPGMKSELQLLTNIISNHLVSWHQEFVTR